MNRPTRVPGYVPIDLPLVGPTLFPDWLPLEFYEMLGYAVSEFELNHPDEVAAMRAILENPNGWKV